jgi:nicotinate dehydrogenase subunit B
MLTAYDFVSANHHVTRINVMNTGGIYVIPNRMVVDGAVERFLPSSSMRSVGDRCTVFASEQMMDELAHAAKLDPVDFRRRNMAGNEHWLELLNTLAKAARWQPRLAASSLSDANVVRGRGVALGTHLGATHLANITKRFAPNLDFRTVGPHTAAGVVAEIEVNKKTGKIVVKHLYAAISPGARVQSRQGQESGDRTADHGHEQRVRGGDPQQGRM